MMDDGGAPTDAGSILPIPDALSSLGDAAWPFVSATTLFPKNQLLDPTVACGSVHDAGDAGAACCGAVADGVHDVTSILQDCINAGSVFLPDGTYLVSKTLTWAGPYGLLQGQSRAGTILKLKDHDSDFQGPDSSTGAACVLSTAGHPTNAAGGTYWVSTGFNNFLSNFTINTGAGNPNGCGIQFHGNNVNAIRDVSVIAGDGQGSLGIDLTKQYPGPSMISGVEVSGFDTGIALEQSQYSITFEHIYLHGQRTYGMNVLNNVVSIRDIESVNSVPVIYSSGQGAFVTLIDSHLQGGAAANSAIVNDGPEGSVFLRNITTSGYGNALNNRGALTKGPLVEFIDTEAGAPVTLFAGPTKSLDLPIEETPYYHDNNLDDWQDVGLSNGKDDTTAIQGALNSGKPIIYFRSDKYYIADTLTVPGTVKQIMGAETLLDLAETNEFSKADAATPYKPVFSVEGGTAGEQVFIEKLMFRGPVNSKADIGASNIVDNTPRTLVIRDTTIGGGASTTVPAMGYLTGTSTAPVFMDDVGLQAHFKNQSAWIRQYDSEGELSTSPAYFENTNEGATVWILGLKTERAPTVIATTNGGKTEVLGGLLYTTSDNPTHDGGATTPAFTSVNSSVSLTFVEEIYNTANIYKVYVEQTENGMTKSLETANLPYHRDGTAHRMPLFVGQ